MNRQRLRDAFLQTLDDLKLSRRERKALKAVLGEQRLDEGDRLALQADLVAAVGDRLKDPQDQRLVEWLGDALALLRGPAEASKGASSRVLFGPKDPMVETLETLIRASTKSLEVAVFTITDNRLRDALVDAHRRRVRVRILSDGHKAHDRGSDIEFLTQAGLPVATDRSRHHFHHKFAIFDGHRLVTGSYNWTVGADRNNRENYLISDDPNLVLPYAEAFEAMWSELS